MGKRPEQAVFLQLHLVASTGKVPQMKVGGGDLLRTEKRAGKHQLKQLNMASAEAELLRTP